MMKKVKILVFILLFFQVILSAQTNYDKIAEEAITINKTSILYKNKSLLSNVFPKPTKVKKRKNDFTKVMYTYKYFGTDMVEINKKGLITAFNIRSKNFVLTNNNIRIGDPLTNFTKYFPLSFSNIRSNVPNEKYLKVSIIGEDDVYLVFNFKYDILFSMEIWYDY
jgi:hypothetical protein